MGAYLSDRLFVALAKKVGFPDKRTLTTYRSLQREFIRSEMPVTLFTLIKLKGVLDEHQADQFVAWARQVAACRPQYREDLRESGAARRAITDTTGVVEVRPTWEANETVDIDALLERDHAASALDPAKDHTEELLQLLDDMSVEETSRSRRAPQAEDSTESDPLDALVSGYVGGSGSGSHVVNVEVVDEAPTPFEESQVDDLLESRVDPLEGPSRHVESHVDLFDDGPGLDDLFEDEPPSHELLAEDDPSVDDCLALLEEDTNPRGVRRSPPTIEDMETDLVEVVNGGVDEDELLELLPEWELEGDPHHHPDSALFDVASWNEAEGEIQALEQDAGLDLDIVDPWADPPTTAAPEHPAQVAAFGPTNAKASAEFVGDPEALLGSESSFDPWGSSMDQVQQPSLYERLKSDSDSTRQGYTPAAAPPAPPPLAPLPGQAA